MKWTYYLSYTNDLETTDDPAKRIAMTRKKSGGATYLGKSLTDDPDDASELLSAFFRNGELRHGDKLIRRVPKRAVVPARSKASQTKP
jgi:hypothetical protein